MIEQTQFPFQQNNVSKTSVITILFIAIFVFVLVSIIREFKNSETKVAGFERLDPS